MRPYSITRVVNARGDVLYARDPSDSIQILSPDTVKFIKELLSDVIKPGGTGHHAAAQNVIGGKTGTSNENRDAWFVGATDKFILGIWVGNDDFTPMSSKTTGGTTPAQIFHDVVQ